MQFDDDDIIYPEFAPTPDSPTPLDDDALLKNTEYLQRLYLEHGVCEHRRISDQAPVFEVTMAPEVPDIFQMSITELILKVELRLNFQHGVEWRCFQLDRLPLFLSTGKDVEPPAEYFHVASDLSKSWEYPRKQRHSPQELGPGKVAVALRSKMLLGASCCLDPSSDRFSWAKSVYKRHRVLKSGVHVFERGPSDIRRASKNQYMRWFPPNPWDAILGAVAIRQ